MRHVWTAGNLEQALPGTKAAANLVDGAGAVPAISSRRHLTILARLRRIGSINTQLPAHARVSASLKRRCFLSLVGFRQIRVRCRLSDSDIYPQALVFRCRIPTLGTMFLSIE